MKIMDLSVYENETLQVKLLNGQIIHIMKPTQKMLILIQSYTNKLNMEDEAKVYEAADVLVWSILSGNEEKVEISKEEIAGWALTMKAAIINGYTQWLNDILKNPT